MEIMNMYMFTELGQIKVVIAAKSIESALHNLQLFSNERTKDEDYFQEIRIVPTTTGIGDWEVEVLENYKVGGEQQMLTKNAVFQRYEVFELPFSFNKVYGAMYI